ncbi:MAG TPA: hypothetical protein VGG48_15955 [Rhizomicrobium sp.]|jgi:hypothetical protein
MRNLKLAALAVVASGLMIGAATAQTTTVAANMGGCSQMASSVRTAMDANASSANIDEAKKEQSLGRDFCGNQFYARGVAHYQHALDLLSNKS